jgi:hypothetical protein
MDQQGVDQWAAVRAMEAAAARLGFSMIEVQYCIGRFRSKTWTTQAIANKFGVSCDTIDHYEMIIRQQALLANPFMNAQIEHHRDEVELKVAEAIVEEGKRRVALVEKLEKDYIDPTQYPRIKK